MRSMNALLRFHLRAGIRMGLRAAAATIAFIPAWIIFQEDPATFIIGLARAAFAAHPTIADVLPLVTLAFLLPAWASGRLSGGANGWLRHLPLSGDAQRRGLLIALVCVQLPVAVLVGIAASIAYAEGQGVTLPLLRWALVMLAGSAASLPVTRQGLVRALAIAATASIVIDPWWMLAGFASLLAIDGVAGPIRVASVRRWQRAGTLLQWRITVRALGRRLIPGYGLGLVPLAFGWFLIHNNALANPAARGVGRIVASLSAVACLYSLTKALAIHRPVWALARSFPVSALRRIADDALFLGLWGTSLVVLAAVQQGVAALPALTLLPLLSIRAAAYVRRIPYERGSDLVFLVEGFVIGAIFTLVPWSAIAWLAVVPAALRRAAEHERRHKVTRWSEWQQASPGDTSLHAA
jgi:hypothetical protein